MLDISEVARVTMVLLIKQINEYMGYREETFYQAVGMADRYLGMLSVYHFEAPSLVSLGFVCIILAAKVNEYHCPSYSTIIAIINTQ